MFQRGLQRLRGRQKCGRANNKKKWMKGKLQYLRGRRKCGSKQY